MNGSKKNIADRIKKLDQLYTTYKQYMKGTNMRLNQL